MDILVFVANTQKNEHFLCKITILFFSPLPSGGWLHLLKKDLCKQKNDPLFQMVDQNAKNKVVFHKNNDLQLHYFLHML